MKKYTLIENEMLFNEVIGHLFMKCLSLRDDPSSDFYQVALASLEQAIFYMVMKLLKGNQSKAAVYLGLSRSTLKKKLNFLGISKTCDIKKFEAIIEKDKFLHTMIQRVLNTHGTFQKKKTELFN